jgi:uncharacterized membrane protein YgaE (UPF0421/DUF939 family)
MTTTRAKDAGTRAALKDGADEVLHRGRLSVGARLTRVRAKGWHIGQAAIAAGVAYFLASSVLGHPTPFFAPIAAVVSLGTSYGQRLRRVAEVTLGVAVGVLIADLLVLVLGTGAWQISLIVALAMSIALLIDAGGLFVTQAAVQSIVVVTFALSGTQALVRWTDAVLGGVVALVAATVVPGAPLRRPRDQSAHVVDTIAALLRGAARGIREGDVEEMLDLLADARETDVLIGELQQAAAEGLSVVRSSPFRARHREPLRQLAELVEPLDLALRNTRVIVRRTAIAAYRESPVPEEYAVLCDDLAVVLDEVASELRADRSPAAVQPRLLELGEVSARLPRSRELSAEVVLAQLRSVIADLLRMTGMGGLESTDAIPPLAS